MTAELERRRAVRGWYADDLKLATGISSKAVVAAFATVARENFVGLAPWHVGRRLKGIGEQWSYTCVGDPNLLYHDAIVALDTEKQINNGLPSLWALCFDRLAVREGETIIHLGCGTGYYTAILAELTGSLGTVVGFEVDATLAAHAHRALAGWANVSTTNGDASAMTIPQCDVVVACAGLTHVPTAWLKAVAIGGRVLLPLTARLLSSDYGQGIMLLVCRTGLESYTATAIAEAGFVDFTGGRSACEEEKLKQALSQNADKLGAIRSLRLDPHVEDATCWLHSAETCISMQ